MGGCLRYYSDDALTKRYHVDDSFLKSYLSSDDVCLVVSGSVGGTYPVNWRIIRLQDGEDADEALQRQGEAVEALAKSARDRKTQKAIKKLASFASMAAQKGVVSVPPVVANDAALTDAQIQRIAEGVLQALTEAYIEIEDEELLLMYASL